MNETERKRELRIGEYHGDGSLAYEPKAAALTSPGHQQRDARQQQQQQRQQPRFSIYDFL